MTPLISVIMASYNHEEFIGDSIKSVLDQTFADFELNIVDDGSNDNSREMIQKYTERDPRIRFLFHEKNEGIAKTYNDGLDMAKGQYIALASSDDLWRKNKLEKQLEVLNADENLIVWSEATIIDGKGQPSGHLFTEMVRAKRRKKNGDVFEELMRGNFICAHIILKRKNSLALRFDENLKYLNDYKFMLELAKDYNYRYLPEPLVMYRVHKGNTINSDAMNWRKDMVKLGEEVLQKYGSKISTRSKTKIYLAIAAANSKLGSVSKSRENLFKAVKLNPFEWFNYTFFVRFVLHILFSSNRNRKNLIRKKKVFGKK